MHMRGFGISWFGRINVVQIALVPTFVVGFVLAMWLTTWQVGPVASQRLHENSINGRQIAQLQSIQAQAALPLQPEPIIAEKVDCNKDKCLALTFDDGPNLATTPQILDELRRANVPASFFVLGWRIPGNETLIKRIYEDGHDLGNHSWDHPDFTQLSPEQAKQQIDRTQAAIVAAGVPAPTLLRPPYGAWNATVQGLTDMNIMLWNADPQDWSANTAEEVVQRVEASARPGAILDMHDIYHVTANALPKIITDLHGAGYHFVTVSQMLDIKPDAHQVFYGHP